MRFLAAAVLGVLGVAGAAAPPSSPQDIPSPKDVVAVTAHASPESVPRGGQFKIVAELKIRSGFHINAREKSADYLIATDLRGTAPSGFQLGEVSYPKGALHTFTFSKTPLNVYEGTIVLQLPATALASAPLGSQHIALKLRYQACSTEICLPPVTIPVDASIQVVEGGARPSRP